MVTNHDSVFLDEEETWVTDGDEEEGKRLLEGDMLAVITSCEIDRNYVTQKTNKKGIKISLAWTISPETDSGWGGFTKRSWLYYVKGGEWACSEVFSAIDLPYKLSETENYKNGNKKKIWGLSQANFVGRGCILTFAKKPGDKYSEITEYTAHPGFTKMTQDEISEMFPDNDSDNGNTNDDSGLPF